MKPLDDVDLLRIAELERESLADWWRRFARERGLELSETDIADLLAMDQRKYPGMKR